MAKQGLFQFNLGSSVEFVLPKHSDHLTERNLMAGIGFDRQIRKEDVADVSSWLKANYNFI
jgi:hypothetical protein